MKFMCAPLSSRARHVNGTLADGLSIRQSHIRCLSLSVGTRTDVKLSLDMSDSELSAKEAEGIEGARILGRGCGLSDVGDRCCLRGG